MLISLHAAFLLFWLSADFFKINFFQKNYFRNTVRVSNGMDADQDKHSVGLGLGPNSLQSLLADDKSHHYITSKERITPLAPVGYSKCSKISKTR